MTYAIGDTYYFQFTTIDTDAQVDADSLPTGVLYVNEASTAVTVTITDSGIGFYRGSCSLAGRSLGDKFWVEIAATIDSVDWVATTDVHRITLDANSRISADNTAISGSTTAADNLETAALAYSATRGLSGTALPAAAADAAGGLAISDAGGLDLDAKLANTNEVTAARMAALTDWINGGRLDLLIDAIKAKTDPLPASPAAVGSAMTLTTGERDAIAVVVDSTLLDAGDATDLIASIVTRIGNTNVDQAAFVAAVKAALFDAASASNKLAVDASGQVTYNNTAPPTTVQINAEVDAAISEASLATAAALAAAQTDLDTITTSSAAAQSAAESVDGKLTTGRAALIDNLDIAISTRLSAAGYTAPANASIAIILADLIEGGRVDSLIDAIKLTTDSVRTDMIRKDTPYSYTNTDSETKTVTIGDP